LTDTLDARDVRDIVSAFSEHKLFSNFNPDARDLADEFQK
jgi:hypothetical protein